MIDTQQYINIKKNINWKKDVMPIIKERLNLWSSQQITPTLRTLFYTLVSLNVLENTPERYGYLSKFTARARENSQIGVKKIDDDGYMYQFEEDEILPIDCFADNVRNILDIDDIYETAEEFYERGTDYFVRNISTNYQIPRWYKQPHYIEVWVEKDAMVGTLQSIINDAGYRQIRIVPTRGQSSVTYAWNNMQRLMKKQRQGKQVHIRYFGDLDPSGEGIERELINKLTLEPYNLKDIDFKRVGVTNDQKEQFNLIPNKDPKTMKKLKNDTNRFAFMEKYGLKSEDDLFQIEVDALAAIAPIEFKTLVLESVDEFFDEDIYQNVLDSSPTYEELHQLRQSKTIDLLISLQNRESELDE